MKFKVKKNNNNRSKAKPNKISSVTMFLIILSVSFILLTFSNTINKDNGYYIYNGTEYYKHASSWYVYNTELRKNQ